MGTRHVHMSPDRQRACALLVCFGLPTALLAARVVRSGHVTFAFLAFNLFLAALPLGFAVAARHEAACGRWATCCAALLAWLLFFPNAPYLLSDFVHLRPRPPIPLWYDVALLAGFAAAGMALGLASLAQVHRIVRRAVGPVGGWVFVAGTSVLSGLGVYVGRFLRWNSWDLFVVPGEVAEDVIVRLGDPAAHPQTWGVSVVFGGFVLALYVVASALRPRTAQTSRRSGARSTTIGP